MTKSNPRVIREKIEMKTPAKIKLGFSKHSILTWLIGMGWDGYRENQWRYIPLSTLPCGTMPKEKKKKIFKDIPNHKSVITFRAGIHITSVTYETLSQKCT